MLLYAQQLQRLLSIRRQGHKSHTNAAGSHYEREGRTAHHEVYRSAANQ